MSKSIRKDWFHCPAEELERWLPQLLENMRYTEIKVQGATRRATANAKERVSLPNGSVDLIAEVLITWTEQSDGLTFIVTAQEAKFEWTGCLCSRICDNILGAMRTIAEIYHGRDL